LKIFLMAVLAVLMGVQGAYAQSGISTDSKEPIEITADETLEWHRNDLFFIARGAARAQQGTSSVAGDLLTARYRKGATSSMEIYSLSAEGSVVLTSEDNVAYGSRADYDLDAGLAKLSGEGLKMVSPDQTITAQERFEYLVNDGRVNALGRAKVTRPKVGGGVDTLEADKISVLLKENASGKRVLHSLEAFGNVVIVTPTETVTGAYGIYRAGSNKAELKGNVKIVRGPNVLEGERAEVDMSTNISKIFGAPTIAAPPVVSGGALTGSEAPAPSSGGRVRGVFYPSSEKKSAP
jgi:lipopolysaccharide export system protein LptA